MRHLRLVMTGVFVALFVIVSQAQMGSAQTAGATLEIHKRVCPADATGNIFDDCHGNPPTQTTTFSVDGGAATAVRGGLGELHGNVDSRCVASDGKVVALADGNGDVWRSARGFEGFERIATGLDAVTGVTVA